MIIKRHDNFQTSILNNKPVVQLPELTPFDLALLETEGEAAKSIMQFIIFNSNFEKYIFPI